jgi:hypothetical protein
MYPCPTIASCFMLRESQRFAAGNIFVGVDILAHTHHPVDLCYAKPVQNVWHECLKSHILHSCHIFGPLKIFRCSIGTALSGIVNEIL